MTDVLSGIIGDLARMRVDVERLKRIEYPTGVACRVHNSANLTIGTGGAGTALTFDLERWDAAGMHEAITNPGRLTCTVAGYYLITGHVQWAAGGTGRRMIQIRLDGTTMIAAQEGAGVAGADYRQSVSAIYYLAAAQYVELIVYQTDGGDLVVSHVDNRSPEFAMAKL